jgi:translation initiation factor eIF-2B subunit delta
VGDLAERLAAIRRDRHSGAAELLRQAAETFSWGAQQPGFSADDLAELGRNLIRAQPAMAPIVNLVQAALAAGAAHVPDTCRDFLARAEQAGQAVAEEAVALIRDGMVVLTHSSSSTVLRALLAARASGRRFQVICTESRPLLEGVSLARKLAAAGIPVRLIVDAAACSMLSQTDLVLVGADAVSSHGLVNKIGTAALALAAKTLGVPVYALASADKFLSDDYHAPAQELRDPAEILTAPIEGVTPVNYYFDLTPLEHLTGLLTAGCTSSSCSATCRA